MHVTDLALNHTLGMKLALPGADHILGLPESLLVLNHVGTVHASAQFALAEACSGEFLLRQLGAAESGVFAVLRSSSAKFRKAARGDLRALAEFAPNSADSVLKELESRGRAITSVLVEIVDAQGVVTMTGKFDWFLQRQPSASASPAA
jgi:hypothetical protein